MDVTGIKQKNVRVTKTIKQPGMVVFGLDHSLVIVKKDRTINEQTLLVLFKILSCTRTILYFDMKN